MPDLLRINMKTREVRKEGVPPEYERLGGRGLTDKILLTEVPATCHPLGSENKLIFAAGLLVNTGFPNCARISAGAKSPLTKGIKESNSGGRFAHELGNLGFLAIVLENKPESSEESPLYSVIIDEKEAKVIETNELKHKGNYETVAWLQEKFGERIATATIGPAGEMQLLGASIAYSDLYGFPDRFAGRGGLGAVMGSKAVKAIVIRPAKERQVEFVNEADFKKISQDFGKWLNESKGAFSKYGTPMMVDNVNEFCGLPTQNFRRGKYEKAQNINAYKLHELLEARNGKYGLPCSPYCQIKCTNLFNDPSGKRVTKIEYETIAMMGSNLLIDDYDVIARMNYLCNDLGLDTIEMGNALAVLMETPLLEFGDSDKAISILESLYKGELLGRILGSGAAVTGNIFGVDRVPVVKGQSLPAYDPRIFKGMSAAYTTSPMGADHTAGPAIPGRVGLDKSKDYGDLSDNIGKIDLTKDLHYVVAVLENMGCCYFIYNGRILKQLSDSVNALYGWETTPEKILQMGKDIIKMELEFNEKAGLARTDDLPRFFRTDLLPETEVSYDLPEEEIKHTWDDLFSK